MTYSKRNQRILETPKLNHQLIYPKPKTCRDSARQDDNTVLPFSCNQWLNQAATGVPDSLLTLTQRQKN